MKKKTGIALVLSSLLLSVSTLGLFSWLFSSTGNGECVIWPEKGAYIEYTIEGCALVVPIHGKMNVYSDGETVYGTILLPGKVENDKISVENLTISWFFDEHEKPVENGTAIIVVNHKPIQTIVYTTNNTVYYVSKEAGIPVAITHEDNETMVTIWLEDTNICQLK